MASKRAPGVWIGAGNRRRITMLSDVARTRARAVLRKLGIEVSRSANPFLRLLATFDVNVILDVGANVGQFALWTRRLGYSGRIISFEPLAGPYAELQRVAKRDAKWDLHNVALGDFDGDAVINRSVSTTFSSLAEQTELTRRTFGDAAVTAHETVPVRRLDSLFCDICTDTDVVLLKIDTQGFEKRVLDGAITSLPSIAGARIELSYQTLYEGESSFDTMVAFMAEQGFQLAMLEPIVFDTGGRRVLQADGTFFRSPP